MPRDDLSIDMTKNMRVPVTEQMDAAAVLEDFVLRANNIPGEASFAFTEMEAKDREMAENKAAADEADNKLQRFIKTHGSHHPNPREKQLTATARDKYAKAKALSSEKVELLDTLLRNFDKHVRTLDTQLNSLTERNEPGFEDPDELPSLIRPSAANNTSRQASLAPSRPNGATSSLPTAGPSSAPAAQALQALNQAISRNSTAPNTQLRLAQSQHSYANSAPATPAASMIMGRHQRESSAGPAVGSVSKRGPRQNSGLASTMPAHPSALARQASMGPGTPKGAVASGSAAAIVAPQSVPQTTRAGSVGPKSASAAGSKGAGSRKGTPGATARKRPPPSKSSLSRQKRPKKSPGSNAESELSEAESGSGEEERATTIRAVPKLGGGIGTAGSGSGGGGSTGGAEGPDGQSASTTTGGSGSGGPTGGGGAATTHAVTKRDTDGDVEMEDEEASDDKKYCLCQNVSFGDMVACDNDDCPYEWFHWSCVDLKSEPTGRWYCPVCRENTNKGKKTK